MTTRRALLRYGVAGALVLAVGGVGLSLQPTVRTAPSEPLKVLDEVEFAILAAVAEALLPGDARRPSARALSVPEKVDHVLSTMHPADVAEVKQVLRLLENGLMGLLLDGRPATFTGASPSARERVLERWRTSRWTLRRTAYLALAGLCNAAYWTDPRVWASVGYAGPPASLVGG